MCRFIFIYNYFILQCRVVAVQKRKNRKMNATQIDSKFHVQTMYFDISAVANKEMRFCHLAFVVHANLAAGQRRWHTQYTQTDSKWTIVFVIRYEEKW